MSETSKKNPIIIIFAGPNGVGKTTLAEKFCKRFELEFINPDKLDRNRIGRINKGKQFLKMLEERIEQNISFCFETTMSGKWLLSFLKRVCKKDYEIGCLYIFVNPVELLKYRIEERVRKGGHFVNFEIVKRRYKRSIKNFWHIYLNFFDRWEIISNIENYKRVAIGSKSLYKIEDEIMFKLFLQEVSNGNT